MRCVMGLILALLSLAGSANGDIIDPIATITIRNDQVNAYGSLVGGFDFVGSLQTPSFLASGTLIAPNWVLTAAHAVGSGSASQYTFTVGGTTYTGAEIIQEPTFTGSLIAGNDIALLRLSTSVSNVTPAPIYGGTDELGRLGVMVGFGSGGNGSSGASGQPGTKRAGQNIIDATAEIFALPSGEHFDERILVTDFDSPGDSGNSLGSPNPVSLESNVVGGDSGGGLFVDFGSGYWLVGVTSFASQEPGGAPLGEYGSFSGFTRVTSHTAFITANSGVTPVGVPELPSWLLMAVILPALVLYYRRAAGRKPAGVAIDLSTNETR